MFCTRCGDQLKEDNLYCPSCGHKVERREKGENEPTIPEKKAMPSWFKGSIILALLALIAVTAGIFFAQNPKKTIEEQLTTIRKNEIPKAYSSYTAQEFKEMTSLEDFREFIQDNPIFLDFVTFRLGKSHVRNQIGIVKATLIADNGEQTVVEFHLRRENGKWKVFLINVIGDEMQFSSVTPEERREVEGVIANQLSLLREQKPSDAYEETTTEEFRAMTSYGQFQTFLKQHPLLTKKHRAYIAFRGMIDEKILALVLLSSNESMDLVEYVLEEEEGNWRIWRQDIPVSFTPLSS